MTEKSWYWPGVLQGDATDAPYDDDEFSDIWRKLFTRDRMLQGIIEDYENELAVSMSGANARVATGAALVDGKFYETDANVDTAIGTPAALTRIDRVVLRKDWAAQTVRVAVLTGIEGGAVPALVQIDGLLWDIPLAQISVTVAPAYTITDERVNARTALVSANVGAMEEIETITGNGAGATLDFQNIPSTFQHLFLIGQLLMDGAVVEAEIEVRFNNDNGANYNDQDIKGEGAAPASAATTGQNEITLGLIPAANASANHAGQLNGYIANYKGTTVYKTILVQVGHIPNNTVGNFEVRLVGGLWEDTSPIDRITLLSTTGGAGNFETGTTVTLYGIN